MPVITTEKYHIHGAQQFVESLTEGLRTYGANTASVNANSTVVSISGNVFSTMRVGDVLIINKGLLVAQGTIDEIRQGKSLEEAFLHLTLGRSA